MCHQQLQLCIDEVVSAYVSVGVLSNVIPALCGCADEDELRAAIGVRSLASLKVCLGVCGLLRAKQVCHTCN